MIGTSIEWADDTVNAWWGCTKVSPGCTNCYAETLGHRFGVEWGPAAPRRIRVEAAIRELDAIARRGDREGRPRRVFLQSMSDLFEDRADLQEPRSRVFQALHRINHDRVRLIPLLLTKRVDVMRREVDRLGAPPRAWFGASIENQATAWERIPELLSLEGNLFVSIEPLLGPVRMVLDVEDHPAADRITVGSYNIGAYQVDALTGRNTDMCRPCPDVRRLSWVIVGGESGRQARPMHPDWVLDIRGQCGRAGVPFFMKQMSTHGGADKKAIPADLLVRELPAEMVVRG